MVTPGVATFIATIAIVVAGQVAAYLAGRTNGERAERKRSEPYRLAAGPIFKALQTERAYAVECTFTRGSGDTWMGATRAYVEPESDPRP